MCSLLWFAAVVMYAYTVVFVMIRAQLTEKCLVMFCLCDKTVLQTQQTAVFI